MWRTQAPVWAGLAATIAVAWIWLVHTGGAMADVPGMAGMPGMLSAVRIASMPDMAIMPGTQNVAANAGIGSTLAMWAVMMIAMMLPTALPSTSLFLGLSMRRRPGAILALPVAAYIVGYLAVWLGYAATAALAQWVLVRAMLLGPSLAIAAAPLGAAVLIAAGIFQLTPLKSACLHRCRSPLALFLGHWRDGVAGAFALGLRGGTWCVGCCWALMAVLFVAGVMNLAWMAVLTVFLLLEKLVPHRVHLSTLSGVFLIGWGAALAGGLLH